MKKFDWAKAVLFGALIWLVTDYFVWCLMSFDLTDAIISKIILVLIADALSFFFALNFRYLTFWQAFKYGLIWISISVILDIAISIRFNMDIFSTWEYILGHALIFIIPTVVARLKVTKDTDVSNKNVQQQI